VLTIGIGSSYNPGWLANMPINHSSDCVRRRRLKYPDC
jgi:hypothetical protein